jgi:two-component system KDP operon response regulator KdpE
MKVLIIEDDRNAADFVNFALAAGWQGIQLLLAYNGAKGIELTRKESPDIVLLDIGLPDINGFDVLRQIRTFSKVPIMVLTVMGDESDMVKALELGADEYIVKPFGQMEIVARIKAIIRRMQTTLSESKELVFGPWRFNPQRHELQNNSFQIVLTPTESAILHLLIINSGKVVTFSSIADELWGVASPSYSDSIRVYISRLRQKIEKEPGYPPMIFTKVGVGYYITNTNK